jgi:adenosylcobinamide kinase/adenosylcobinamide-phosphate guanylyltransferase
VTVEEPLDLASRVRALGGIDVLVLDCLTIWIANLLLRGDREHEVLERVDELAGLLAAAPFHAIVVSNEVGMGVVPESALGRVFRDVCGRAHRRLAHDATDVYLAALGLLLRLRPEPISIQPVAGRA